MFYYIVRSETFLSSFPADLYFVGVHFFLSFLRHEISELRRLIAAKFCAVVQNVVDFIIPVSNFGVPLPKNWAKNQNCPPCLSDTISLQ